MRSPSARRARTSGCRTRPVAAAVVLLAAGVLLPLAASAPAAHAAAACVTPVVRDVMISQGLPTYHRLARGKTSLARYFLSAPSCAPTGSTIRITQGVLDLTRKADGVKLATVPLVATLPLPPVGPSSSSPVLAAESDPMFTIPGTSLQALEDAPLTLLFTVTLDFEARYADGTVEQGQITTSTRPGGAPVEAVLERRSHPLRVLAVPMGDGGADGTPTSYSTQFPDQARTALANGMTAVARSLPLADGVSDLLLPSGGLRYSLNAGMVNLHRFMSNGVYCGSGGEFAAVERDLALHRTNWNSMNPASYADYAYGVIWQGVSRGATTGGAADAGCADGYARIGGKASWGRVVAATSDRPGVTGAIATMELMHNTGSVLGTDKRHDGGYHSINREADVSAPERAWNTLSRTWLREDRSAMQFGTTGWHEGNTLLEKEDYDRLLCQLTPSSSSAACPNPGTVGVAAASVADGEAFFVTGSTDGTAGGTKVHTYLDRDSNAEAPDPASDYRFVQRNGLGQVVADDGLPVRFEDSHHHGDVHGGNASTLSGTGVFGVQLPAKPDTVRIQLYKGSPGDPAAVLLHERLRNAAPTFLGVSARGRTVTVTATDETPETLRLDLFLRCPQGTSPLANAVEPVVVAGRSVFVASYDTSLGCPQGRLVYRVTDGYLVAVQEASEDVLADLQGSAAIYSPAPGLKTTQGRVLALTGSARDAADRPADELLWTLKGGSFGEGTQIATGQQGEYVLPKDLAPGTYSLQLTARSGSPQSSVVASAVRQLVVLADSDGDGIADVDEGSDKSCYPSNAAHDATNAALDPDLDGFASIDDLSPCEGTSTFTVSFSPTSLQKGSQGVPVTVGISGSPVDLRGLSESDLQIVQIAGYRLPAPVPATSFAASDATSGSAKFDRGALNQFLRDHDLIGYTPLFVAVPSRGLRGVDPTAPRVFP